MDCEPSPACTVVPKLSNDISKSMGITRGGPQQTALRTGLVMSQHWVCGWARCLERGWRHYRRETELERDRYDELGLPGYSEGSNHAADKSEAVRMPWQNESVKSIIG